VGGREKEGRKNNISARRGRTVGTERLTNWKTDTLGSVAPKGGGGGSKRSQHKNSGNGLGGSALKSKNEKKRISLQMTFTPTIVPMTKKEIKWRGKREFRPGKSMWDSGLS